MKYTFTICAFVFLSVISANGQRIWGIRLYQNTDFVRVEKNQPFERSSSQAWYSHADRFSLAITLTGEKKFVHELELMVPEFNRSTDNVKFPYPYSTYSNPPYNNNNSTDAFSLRYSISKTVVLAPKIWAGLGLALNPYYTRGRVSDDTGYFFSRSLSVVAVSFNLLPSIHYALSQRFSLSLSIPFKMYDLKYEKSRIGNPAVPIEYQYLVNGIEHDFLDRAYTIRLGLHFNLTKPGAQEESGTTSKKAKPASKYSKHRPKSKRPRR